MSRPQRPASRSRAWWRRRAGWWSKATRRLRACSGGFTVDNDETRGVRATADGQTQGACSRSRCATTRLKAGVALDELGDRPVSVFGIMPHEFVKEGSIHSNVLRLWVSAALRALYRPPKTVCTFWLNEFAALGRLAPIESALGLVAGYGIQLVIVVQSLTQLQRSYEDGWENFLGQAGCVLVGPPADKFTADYLSSSRSGEKTIIASRGRVIVNPGGFGMSSGEGYTRRPHLSRGRLYRAATRLMAMSGSAGLQAMRSRLISRLTGTSPGSPGAPAPIPIIGADGQWMRRRANCSVCSARPMRASAAMRLTGSINISKARA